MEAIQVMSRPSARAPNPPILAPQQEDPERVTPPRAPIVAFAVIKTMSGYTPTRVTIDNGQVVEYYAMHEEVNSQALAYEYLQGDVAMHYGRSTR